jgi:hypothetical protein
MKKALFILLVAFISCTTLAQEQGDSLYILPTLAVDDQIEEIETYTVKVNWYGEDSAEGVRNFLTNIRRLYPGLTKKKFVHQKAQMVFEIYVYRPKIIGEHYRLVTAGAGQKYAVEVEYEQPIDLLVKDGQGNIIDLMLCEQDLIFKSTYNVSTMYRRVTGADGSSAIRYNETPTSERSFGIFKPSRGDEIRNILDTLYWILQEKKNREKEMADM